MSRPRKYWTVQRPNGEIVPMYPLRDAEARDPDYLLAVWARKKDATAWLAALQFPSPEWKVIGFTIPRTESHAGRHGA